MSSGDDQVEEIRRLLHCASSRADAFSILQLDPKTCELSDINRSFRRIVLKVHPDKCSLAKAADAFHVAENAHKLLSNEAVLVRLKIAHQKRLEKESALREEAARRAANAPNTNTNANTADGEGAGLTKEEQARRRRREQVMEQQLEAARLAEEAARKKQRVEREAKDRAELAAELERQRKEWKDLNLF